MPFVVAAVSAVFSVARAVFSVAAIRAVGSYALKTFALAAASKLATDLLGPKQKQEERQASITTLSLGEHPREAIFGRAQTGGSLNWAWNYGGDNGTDHEVLVIILADHLCEALEGFWVDDQYYAFTADGSQSAFVHGGDPKLNLYWRNGAVGQTFPAGLMSGGGFTTDDLKGVAYVVADYKTDPDGAVWPSGRPTFKFLVKGKRLYDPRKDSSVGGSGVHRWATPSTWEWDENAYLCRYNWARGIYALDQVDQPQHLLIGRGLSAVEAPPANAFAPANLCDEAVALKAGGTEKRYRVGGVIRSNETFIEVEEMFAAAMAGQIIQPDGTVDIAPGVAKASVASITDDDLVVGEPVYWSDFRPGPERVNSIIPSYVEPAQSWRTHSAPVRRSVTDIASDGGPFEETLDLSLVTSGAQAQRCGEIRRRKVRLERTRTITLPPWFSHLEEGDWITWTSARFDGGASRVWEVQRHVLARSRRVSLTLVEIASSVFAWTAATDEMTPGAVALTATTAPDPLELAGVGVATTSVAGQPVLRFTWDTPVDPAIWAIRAEARLTGDTETLSSVTLNPQAGVLDVPIGVGGGAAMQGRLTPEGHVERTVVGSSWISVVQAAAPLDLPPTSLTVWDGAAYREVVEIAGGQLSLTEDLVVTNSVDLGAVKKITADQSVESVTIINGSTATGHVLVKTMNFTVTDAAAKLTVTVFFQYRSTNSNETTCWLKIGQDEPVWREAGSARMLNADKSFLVTAYSGPVTAIYTFTGLPVGTNALEVHAASIGSGAHTNTAVDCYFKVEEDKKAA